jgi:MYXO-CTERM domain-containing protein
MFLALLGAPVAPPMADTAPPDSGIEDTGHGVDSGDTEDSGVDTGPGGGDSAPDTGPGGDSAPVIVDTGVGATASSAELAGEKGGCGCDPSGGAGAGAWALLLAAGAARRRRR